MTFSEVITKLNENQIPFYISGSFLLSLKYGVRPNDDIDFVVRREDFEKIEEVFNVQKFVRDGVFGNPADCVYFEKFEFCAYDKFLKGNKLYSFAMDESQLDSFPTMNYDGVMFKVAPIEELMIMKLFMARKNDYKDDIFDVKLILRSTNISYKKAFELAKKYNVKYKFLYYYCSIKLKSFFKPGKKNTESFVRKAVSLQD